MATPEQIEAITEYTRGVTRARNAYRFDQSPTYRAAAVRENNRLKAERARAKQRRGSE